MKLSDNVTQILRKGQHSSWLKRGSEHHIHGEQNCRLIFNYLSTWILRIWSLFNHDSYFPALWLWNLCTVTCRYFMNCTWQLWHVWTQSRCSWRTDRQVSWNDIERNKLGHLLKEALIPPAEKGAMFRVSGARAFMMGLGCHVSRQHEGWGWGWAVQISKLWMGCKSSNMQHGEVRGRCGFHIYFFHSLNAGSFCFLS